MSTVEQHTLEQSEVENVEDTIVVEVTGLPVGDCSDFQEIFLKHNNVKGVNVTVSVDIAQYKIRRIQCILWCGVKVNLCIEKS